MLTPIADGESFDMEHYANVRDARFKAGMNNDISQEIPGHRWIGKTLYLGLNGTSYVIEKVMIHWHLGRYIALLCRVGDSHRLLWWENISSVNSHVIESINFTRRNGFIVL